MTALSGNRINKMLGRESRIMLLLVLLCISTMAFGKDVIAIYATSANLNLRAAPVKTARVITTVPKGTKLNVTGFRNDWAEVMYNGQMVFAASDYLLLVREVKPQTEKVANSSRGNASWVNEFWGQIKRSWLSLIFFFYNRHHHTSLVIIFYPGLLWFGNLQSVLVGQYSFHAPEWATAVPLKTLAFFI